MTCSKPARIEGRVERFCPIFPELRPLRLKSFENADAGTQHVIRATRESELTERFPAHVVAMWIGNTEQVAQEPLPASDRYAFRTGQRGDRGRAARPTGRIRSIRR